MRGEAVSIRKNTIPLLQGLIWPQHKGRSSTQNGRPGQRKGRPGQHKKKPGQHKPNARCIRGERQQKKNYNCRQYLLLRHLGDPFCGCPCTKRPTIRALHLLLGVYWGSAAARAPIQIPSRFQVGVPK